MGAEESVFDCRCLEKRARPAGGRWCTPTGGKACDWCEGLAGEELTFVPDVMKNRFPGIMTRSCSRHC